MSPRSTAQALVLAALAAASTPAADPASAQPGARPAGRAQGEPMLAIHPASPQPGDVFREYLWFNEKGDAGQALRVGTRGITPDYATEPICPPWNVDLEHAVRAELVFEKILCHDGTRGLAVEVNGASWLPVPEAPGIPAPPESYQHHTYPVVPVPLGALRPGPGNAFRLRVAAEHPWNWPQNLINGLHLRVFYDPARTPHPRGRIEGIAAGTALGARVALRTGALSPATALAEVTYVGLYTDVNFEGDGVYRQWHGHHDHGRFVHHLGTATTPPFEVTWDTSWVPDQDEPMQLSARMTDRSGLATMLPAVGGLSLNRAVPAVELCELRNVPPRWVTRRGELSETFVVRGDLSRAVAMQLAWCSWSPGYMNGIAINGTRVVATEGPRYQAFWHRLTLDPVSALRPGENTLTTGLTPKHGGTMVHGMEVNWPGIMVLIRYRPPEELP